MIAHHTYHYDLWLSRLGGAKQDMQVADVSSGWAGEDQLAELFEGSKLDVVPDQHLVFTTTERA